MGDVQRVRDDLDREHPRHAALGVEDGREAALLIKSINAADMPEPAAELQLAASDHPTVRVVDVALADSERFALQSP